MNNNAQSLLNFKKFVFIIIVLAIITAFYFFNYKSSDNTHSGTNQSTASNTSQQTVSYTRDIKPLLEKRCIVCHGCYDAPCQLKLSSIDGITRGASKEKVYNPRRLIAIEPTRLFIDARSNKEWRNKGFHSVLDADNESSNKANNKSLMQKLTELKQRHPLPDEGKLPSDFTLELEREQECPTQNNFDDYAKEHPLWGMPYAMPNLNKNENLLLEKWFKSGAVLPPAETLKNEAAPQVAKWEVFLNQTSNKQRLISRYIYEHLFHAHIHFDDTANNEFYRLVRSTTSPGTPIDEIATLRPYDSPGTNSFYYRLLPYTPSIVTKNHIVYTLSDKRMARYQQLFLSPDYKVEKLPSYSPVIASNPFKAFAAIPPDSRYRFLLDDARFFIEGFVKGPVCRGQVALNVIEDQFWIVFFNPEQKIFTLQASFLNSMSDYLKIPSERKSHLNLLPIWTDYWRQQKQYMTSKQRYFEKIGTHDLHHAMNFIWDGGGENTSAALTVFRHFDSASVEYGLVGDEPETMWVIDYPLLERIHYLLVAGFNIYGNVGHQLSTRIFMDFLRMEGEDYFLAFLPVEKRKAIRDSWYQGMRAELDVLFKAPMDWLKVESVKGYQTDDAKYELYQHIKQRLGNVLVQSEHINRCGSKNCNQNNRNEEKTYPLKTKLDDAMKRLSRVKGKQLHDFPEVSFVRITTDDPDQSYSYSLLRNKAYKNVTSLLSDERKRNLEDIEQDTLTVNDWLAGSYPNFFFSVKAENIDEFIAVCTAINTQQDFDRFVERYGVRRTSPSFWEMADWFQSRYTKQRPLHSGLYDLSRYSNL